MKPKKDIFDLFRDNQQKLNESPSRQAWDRLEARLDNHKTRNRTSLYRILSMAAAIVVLVVFVSVITFVLNTNEKPMALNESMSASFKIEELKVMTVSSEHDSKIAAYQRKYNNHLSNPIMEGKANKKLIAKMDIERRDGNLNSFIAKAKRENQQSFAISSMSANAIAESDQRSAAVEVYHENEDYSISEDVAVSDSESLAEEESSEDNTSFGLKDLAVEDEVIAQKEEAKEIETLSMKKAKRYADAPAAAKTDQASKIMESPLAGAAMGQGKSDFGIQQFQWLTGKWEGNVNNQVSIEQWKQVDNQTLEGRGFLMVNDQSVFNENMKIQEMNGVIYFVADLNGTGDPIYYQLISNDGFQAVFENKNVNFPNQVVLQRTNSSNFSTIYQNTQPGNIDETQQNYYLNRNYIQKEQVIRNLRRVND